MSETFTEFCKNNSCKYCEIVQPLMRSKGGSTCEHCFMQKHDAKVRVDVIDEIKEAINEHLFDSPMINPIMTRTEILLLLDQLKEKKQ